MNLSKLFKKHKNPKDRGEEVAEIVCRAWNTLDANLIEPLLSNDFEYESVWVFETMKGKNRYLDYLRGKFKAIKDSGSVVKAEVYYQEIIGKHIVILNQDGKGGTALEIALNKNGIKQIWMRPPSLTLPATFTSKPKGDVVARATAANQIKSIELEDCSIEKEMEELAKKPEEERPWYMKSMKANDRDIQHAVRCIKGYFSTNFPNSGMHWIGMEEKTDYCDLTFTFGDATFDLLIEYHYGNVRFLDITPINKLVEECKNRGHVACIAALRSETEVSFINPTTSSPIDFSKYSQEVS